MRLIRLAIVNIHGLLSDEKVVADQVYCAFAPGLSPNLSGYLKGHSCCTALLKMAEDRKNCKNQSLWLYRSSIRVDEELLTG